MAKTNRQQHHFRLFLTNFLMTSSNSSSFWQRTDPLSFLGLAWRQSTRCFLCIPYLSASHLLASVCLSVCIWERLRMASGATLWKWCFLLMPLFEEARWLPLLCFLKLLTQFYTVRHPASIWVYSYYAWWWVYLYLQAWSPSDDWLPIDSQGWQRNEALLSSWEVRVDIVHHLVIWQ